MQRRGGIIQITRNGSTLDAKGAFSYNLGQPKRTPILGSSGVQGFSDAPQSAYIEGAITDRSTLDLKDLVLGNADTVTLILANGKTILLSSACFTGDGTGNTEEGEIAVRWDSDIPAEEI